MKYLFLCLLMFSIITVSAQFNKHFKNKTCRIDYYHSGDHDDEYYVLDKIIREPKWSGSKVNLVDTFDFGQYKFMVYDSATNELLYSRGYSTLFNEYQATQEAKTQAGNFAESIVFPFPKKIVRVDLYSRNKDMEWEKQYEVFADPKNPDIKQKNNHSYKKFKIHKSGNPNKKFDLVILPEGYTAGQMEKFRADAKRFTGYLLNTDPYKFYSDKINVWGVLAASEEEGTDLPGDSVWKKTLLNSNFYTFGSERYLTTADYFTVRDVASNAPNDQIFILVNHEKYGGGGIYNFYSVATSDNETSDFLMIHEFGHAFAGLGDEYYTSDVAVEDFYNLDKEPWEPNLTSLVDFDSKWKDMLKPGTPVPTPVTDEYQGQVGVFEGGGYVAEGIYRPYLGCTMNVVKFDNFCPVCKRAIRRMIEFYSK